MTELNKDVLLPLGYMAMEVSEYEELIREATIAGQIMSSLYEYAKLNYNETDLIFADEAIRVILKSFDARRYDRKVRDLIKQMTKDIPIEELEVSE